jgi:hypothetical protein
MPSAARRLTPAGFVAPMLATLAREVPDGPQRTVIALLLGCDAKHSCPGEICYVSRRTSVWP